jgi:hypothetical protein
MAGLAKRLHEGSCTRAHMCGRQYLSRGLWGTRAHVRPAQRRAVREQVPPAQLQLLQALHAAVDAKGVPIIRQGGWRSSN